MVRWRQRRGERGKQESRVRRGGEGRDLQLLALWPAPLLTPCSICLHFHPGKGRWQRARGGSSCQSGDRQQRPHPDAVPGWAVGGTDVDFQWSWMLECYTRRVQSRTVARFQSERQEIWSYLSWQKGGALAQGLFWGVRRSRQSDG